MQTFSSPSVDFIPDIRNSMDVKYFFDNGQILLMWKTFCGISENPVLLKEGAVCSATARCNQMPCTARVFRLALSTRVRLNSLIVDKVAYTTTNIFVA